MKNQLPIAVIVIIMLYLRNVVMWSIVLGLLCFLFHVTFAWKCVFIISVIMTIFQLVFCKIQE